MYFKSATVLLALAATAAQALPLNINLGAYSPALVVGDGEISFGGEATAEALVNTLEGAAVTGAAANTAEAPVEAATISEKGVLNEEASLPVPGSAKELDPRLGKREEATEQPQKRDLAGFDRALTYAEAALQKGPKIQLGTPASGVGIIVDNNQEAAALPGTGVAEK
ncbi:hypothetical protein NKR23_g12240 [Pleurostoma richardsiae]|uniref:Uncharacterized protein n=1 Tax=Pleurostoma richardsiae TaxID=41990 RepID=A0AA38VFS5_9PEZI|nr:hypothetical protein NKR23_g12240 [Pleurostoma richardsiae]